MFSRAYKEIKFLQRLTVLSCKMTKRSMNLSFCLFKHASVCSKSGFRKVTTCGA